jgi:hypothetical protein
MKKIFALFLIAILIGTFVGCSKTQQDRFTKEELDIIGQKEDDKWVGVKEHENVSQTQTPSENLLKNVNDFKITINDKEVDMLVDYKDFAKNIKFSTFVDVKQALNPDESIFVYGTAGSTTISLTIKNLSSSAQSVEDSTIIGVIITLDDNVVLPKQITNKSTISNVEQLYGKADNVQSNPINILTYNFSKIKINNTDCHLQIWFSNTLSASQIYIGVI